MDVFATAAKGTEGALRDELREHRFRGVRADRGGVHFAGSLEAATATLEGLGFEPDEARRTTSQFAEHDERMVRRTFALKDDQEALIRAAKEYSAELERLFDEDARKSPPGPLAEPLPARHTDGP